MQNCDLIVIGAGPGGYEVAAQQAAAGKNVVIIEKDLPGGTCLNRGCIPTKCMCAAAELIHEIGRASQFGIAVDGFRPSYRAAVERARAVTAELRQGVMSLLARCTFVEGEAVVQPDGSVSVGDSRFVAPQVIIATGSRPAVLPVPGAELAMSSDDFLKLEELPADMVIVGGGVIGLEFAYIASAYGCKVTVVEYCKEILPPFDAETAKRLRMLLAGRGITFVTSAAVTSIVRNDGDGSFTVGYTDKRGENAVVASAVLMAVGRRAVLPAGLDAAGIRVDSRGFIATDDDMRTSRPGFYAVGDCNGRLMLAHAASAQARRAVGLDVNLDVTPSAVFTSPQLAMVGLTAEQCKEREIDYVSHKALYRSNGKALASGQPDGFVKVLYDPISRRLYGCHILGAEASDLIQEATLAIANNLTVDHILSTIHGHPTLSELLPHAL